LSVRKNIKRILFSGLLAILVIPLINSFIEIIPQKALSGYIERKADTVFNLETWFSGRYQVKEDEFVRDSFGCRIFFIRLHNKIRYTLANKATAADIIVGKHGYIYGSGQVPAYDGENFQGVKKAIDQVSKLKFIQDTLAKLKKTFMFIFAPGKANYYPEYLPEQYCNTGRMNAYTCYSSLAQSFGVNVLDLNKYFLKIKETSPYKLYTLSSTHWTKYGSCIAGDSILSYIEEIGKYKLNHPHWDSIILSEAEGSEIENEEEMNLFFKLKREQLGHPRLSFKPDTGFNRPSALIVSDSYYWGLKENFKFENAFSKVELLYYDRQVYRKGESDIKSIMKINLKEEIGKSNVIIIMLSEGNYAQFGWGFIDDVYALFTGKTPPFVAYYNRLNELKAGIRNSPEWLHRLELSAKAKGIPVDSAVTLEAISIIERQ